MRVERATRLSTLSNQLGSRVIQVATATPGFVAFFILGLITMLGGTACQNPKDNDDSYYINIAKEAVNEGRLKDARGWLRMASSDDPEAQAMLVLVDKDLADEEATYLLKTAEEQIRNKQTHSAEISLESYLESPACIQRDRASQLLREVKLSTSKAAALSLLNTMDDSILAKAAEGQSVQFDFISDPTLRSIFEYTLRTTASQELVRRNEQRLREERDRLAQADFESWISVRLNRSNQKDSMFHSMFSGLMKMLDEQSVTPESREEMRVVTALMDTVGYAVFNKHYEEVLREVYSPSDYRDENRGELVLRKIEARRESIVKDVLGAISQKLPSSSREDK